MEDTKRYGWVAVTVIILSVLIGVANPVAHNIKANFSNIVANFGNRIGNSLESIEDDFGFVNEEKEEKEKEDVFAPGLYETGSNYTKLLKTWNELLDEGVVRFKDGIVYTNFNRIQWINSSSSMLAGDLALPNDGSVMALGESAFDSCYSLTGIVIPDGVKSIGVCSFYGCSNLTNLRLPDSVENIEESAFFQCSGLTSIKIPKNTTIVGYWAFGECTGLTSVEFHDNVMGINNGAFYNCTKLTNVTIPSKVRYIEENAFHGCTALKSMTVKAIEPPVIHLTAFADCSSLNTIHVPDESVEAYKTADVWSNHTSKFQVIT